jgi:protein SCO1/2
VVLCLAWTGLCHEEGESEAPATGERADIEEKVGATLPGELWFTDSAGTRRRLDSLLTQPAILALVFYQCTAACNVMLDNLATALCGLPEKPGPDYTVLVVSFDESDTPETARKAKDGVLQIVGPE